jgi:predicted transcriptional regulator
MHTTRTITEIAEELGLSSSTVRRKCLALGIKLDKMPRVDRNGAVQKKLVISADDAKKIVTYYTTARAAAEETVSKKRLRLRGGGVAN